MPRAGAHDFVMPSMRNQDLRFFKQADNSLTDQHPISHFTIAEFAIAIT